MDEGEVRAALADEADTNRFRSSDWAGPPPGEWVDPRWPDTRPQPRLVGRLLLWALVVACALVLVAGISALAMVSPWLLVPVAGVLAYWAQRLRIASARRDQIITEETDRG